MRSGQLEQTLQILRLVHFLGLLDLGLSQLRHPGILPAPERLIDRNLVLVVLGYQIGHNRSPLVPHLFPVDCPELEQTKHAAQLVHLVDQLVELIESIIDQFYEIFVLDTLSDCVESEGSALSLDFDYDHHGLLVDLPQLLLLLDPITVLLDS